MNTNQHLQHQIENIAIYSKKRVNYCIKGVEDLTHCLALFVYINLDVYHLKNKPFTIIIIIIHYIRVDTG